MTLTTYHVCWDLNKIWYSTNISLYLRNGAWLGHSYCGMLTGTHICALSKDAIWPLSDLSTLNHHIFYMLYRPSHLRNWRILQMWQLSWTQKVLAYRSGHVSQFWSFGAKTLSATNNNFALAAYNHGLASISTISFPITVLINVPHVKLS